MEMHELIIYIIVEHYEREINIVAGDCVKFARAWNRSVPSTKYLGVEKFLEALAQTQEEIQCGPS